MNYLPDEDLNQIVGGFSFSPVRRTYIRQPLAPLQEVPTILPNDSKLRVSPAVTLRNMNNRDLTLFNSATHLFAFRVKNRHGFS
ncbi:hypothetical protein [Legionella bononiensis]|uniref:MSP domain-containing protein n=1 Tax=Legionella bononiensis TaxID=2793102 RepID=A0ABS1WCG7_9GAMM|nr:hypothetical protein [Legionella bononiensis]MBL7478926.1 hypothetical protein [Legionella bononiensis]MBL7527058.1 hypothetical protein [Legionella bononiensis]MBL7562027.1 hypothetical protein [Legionella bononiensis]